MVANRNYCILGTSVDDETDVQRQEVEFICNNLAIGVSMYVLDLRLIQRCEEDGVVVTICCNKLSRVAPTEVRPSACCLHARSLSFNRVGDPETSDDDAARVGLLLILRRM